MAPSIRRIVARLRNSGPPFTLWTLFCSCLFANQLKTVSTDPLYTDKDNILLLNQSTFAGTVYDQDRAFIIEFYNSWCGHCIRYAPTWKAIAKDIKVWKNVVALAAVDCAQADNVQICQDYDIPAFPTVKVFWTRLGAVDLGEVIEHKDAVTVRKNVINFLDKNARKKGIPSSWPSLLPINVRNLNDVWLNIPLSVQNVMLIVETSDSYVGREVILDFSGTDAHILRALDSQSSVLDQLSNPIRSFPALLLLRRNAAPEILWIGKSHAREEFRSAIEIVLGITLDKDPEPIIPDNEANGTSIVKPNVQLPVQMVDLETALYYILTQEVVLKKQLSGENLSAIKSFLAALTKSFPGRWPVMRFLQSLYEWISNQDQVVNMDQWQQTISDLESEESFLPASSKWVGCKGSQSKYRGYPCGLWTLFHSMTVQAYRQYLTGETTYPQQVLFAIRNYILHFFSCTDCAQHFKSISSTMEAQTRNPNDTVLWLWQAHNRVNHRLKGDTTEDPQHPKVQFPSNKLCPRCRTYSESNSPIWDLPEVLYFMNTFYGRSRISSEGVVGFQSPTTTTEGTVIKEPKFQSNKGYVLNFRYFSGLDVSLCVLLYVFSMVLLILVFVVFRLRRRKLKRKIYILP